MVACPGSQESFVVPRTSWHVVGSEGMWPLTLHPALGRPHPAPSRGSPATFQQQLTLTYIPWLQTGVGCRGPGSWGPTGRSRWHPPWLGMHSGSPRPGTHPGRHPSWASRCMGSGQRLRPCRALSSPPPSAGMSSWEGSWCCPAQRRSWSWLWRQCWAESLTQSFNKRP